MKKKASKNGSVTCDIAEKFVFAVWALQYILNSTSSHYQEFTSLHSRSRSLRPLPLWKNISSLVLLCSKLSICYDFAPQSGNKRVNMQVGRIVKTQWLTVLWEAGVCVCVCHMWGMKFYIFSGMQFSFKLLSHAVLRCCSQTVSDTALGLVSTIYLNLKKKFI